MASAVSDDAYESWLCDQLTLADDKAPPYVPASHSESNTLKPRTIPLSLLEIISGLCFPGHGDTPQWAQWLMESVYTMPPAQLVGVIEREMRFKGQLAHIIASAALKALTQER